MCYIFLRCCKTFLFLFRFEIGEWHLEGEGNMEGGVVNDLIEADTGEGEAGPWAIEAL